MADALAPARILLVEDEWLIAESLSADVAQAGYAVVGPASCLEKGLAIIDREAISAAIRDVSLGEEKSYPLARRLRDKSIPFMFLSGYSDADLPAEFAGAMLLTKPIAGFELDRAIERLLAQGKR